MKQLLLLSCLLVCTSHVWSQTTPPATYPSSFTVAQDGSGNFKTIQEAVNSFRDHSQVRVTLYVKNGVYAEKLVIPSWKPNIHVIGESKEGVVITGNDYSGKAYPGGNDWTGKDKYSTYTSYTVLVDAPDIILENLTIRNTAGRVGQAVALHVEGDRFVCKNCILSGNQDTLYAAAEGSRQYYENCFIEGTTDFIFGKSISVFQSCTIKSLSDSFITAAATPGYQRYGFVFFDCKLIADQAAKKVYLGRPWRPNAKTIFIRTDMGDHILPVGWDNWGNPANEKTVLYAEYGNTGAGGNSSKRTVWSKNLTDKEASTYTLATIFSEKSVWLPNAARP
ncbi:pectinesterase family protein [Spirosoma endbachense]|uniref:Pectinesterase n=1 Tax=Spirosoma endbachense TaxID=2666025 RepID=A0A6P1W4T5_9BACT|nr:pectinesterase family protein [Spirosoma endbachense]QHW00026.1 pectin esterase [Spirosoma endbachense]